MSAKPWLAPKPSDPPPPMCKRCNVLPQMGTLPCIYLCAGCYALAQQVSARVNRGRKLDSLPRVAQGHRPADGSRKAAPNAGH